MPKHVDIDDYLASLPDETRRIGAELRAVIDAALPETSGTIWHGSPVWMAHRTPRAGFKAYASHVTFMIWNGKPIEDPSDRLEPGARMGTVKLRTVEDVDHDAFTTWLRAAHAR